MMIAYTKAAASYGHNCVELKMKLQVLSTSASRVAGCHTAPAVMTGSTAVPDAG